MVEHSTPSLLEDRPSVVAAAAAALLGVALLDLPYGYYQFLRVAVCAAALYVAYRLHADNQIVPLLGAAAIAILFNPLYEMEFDPDEWQVIDAAAALAFAAYALWRVSTPDQRTKRFMTAGALLGAGAFVMAAPSMRSSTWDDHSGNTANYTADESLMGSDITAVDALNGTDANLGYDPYSGPSEVTATNLLTSITNNTASTNLLDSYLAPPPRPTDAVSALDEALNSIDEAADVVGNVANDSMEE